jgi:lipoate-protein ligase A
MEKIFDRLLLWEDVSLRNPAEQMACDEALLRSAGCPVLRLYRWAAPAVTFGYSQRLERVRAEARGLPLMRRWTGGGVVFHGDDLTLALAMPASEQVARLASPEIYQKIHESLLKAVRGVFANARMVAPDECREGPVCFESPVAHDLALGNSKLCGGALRRSREGVLYQGSLHGQGIAAHAIAHSLASQVEFFKDTLKDTSAIESLARRIASERYTSIDWLMLR